MITSRGGQKVGDNQETARPEHSFLLHDHAGRIHRMKKADCEIDGKESADRRAAWHRQKEKPPINGGHSEVIPR